MSTTATTAQLDFVKKLAEKRTAQLEITDVDEFIALLRVERITSKGASATIDHLLAMPEDPKSVLPGTTVSYGPTNAYPGKCVNCGVDVAAQEGERDRRNGRWVVFHHADDPRCGDKPAAQDEPVAAPANLSATIDDIISGKIPTGRLAWSVAYAQIAAAKPGGYAVPSITGTNDLTFFRIKINQGKMNPSKKGEHYFATVIGGRGDGDVQVSPAYILKALRAVAAASYVNDETGEAYSGAEAAERLFGNEIGICGRCGVQLTSEWRKRGIGPVCVNK